jgi:hypothetical protein
MAMDRTHELVPAARFERLVMTEAGGEVLVYDERSHHIHRLNQASAAVWRLCDGRRTVAHVASETGMPVELVQVALGKLADAGLLDGELPAGMRAAGQSRRRFLTKAVVAGGVALPVLVSISAPTAVQAQSCLGLGTPCLSSAQCCLGLCGTTATSTSPVCRLPVVGCPGGRCG